MQVSLESDIVRGRKEGGKPFHMKFRSMEPINISSHLYAGNTQQWNMKVFFHQFWVGKKQEFCIFIGKRMVEYFIHAFTVIC